MPGYPGYILRVSEVLLLGFPSCLEDFQGLGFPLADQEPRFSEVFIGLYRLGVGAGIEELLRRIY